MSTNPSKPKISGAYRALEIILGIVAIAIAITAIIFPTITVVTLVVLFGIALMAIGILKIAAAATSMGLGNLTRSANAVIGIIALIIGLIVVFFPGFATIFIVVLLGIGLIIWGIGRIAAAGAAGKTFSSGLKALLVILGILIIILGFIVIFVPVIGVFTYAFFFAIALFLIGIDALASGIVGAKIL